MVLCLKPCLVDNLDKHKDICTRESTRKALAYNH